MSGGEIEFRLPITDTIEKQMLQVKFQKSYLNPKRTTETSGGIIRFRKTWDRNYSPVESLMIKGNNKKLIR